MELESMYVKKGVDLDMRVLHFVSTLNRNSGIMRVLMSYYTHINRDHLQFDFLYFLESEESYINEIHAMGGRTFYISKPTVSFHTCKSLLHFFKEHGSEYEWLHNHENYLTVFLYPFAKKYGIKHIAVHAHLTQYSDKKRSAVRNSIFCFPLAFLPIKRVACSRAAALFLFGNRDDVYIMRNMIETKQFAYHETERNAVRETLYIPNDAFVLGHIGRFELQKNHRFLIELFEQISDRIPGSRLLLVGSGSLEKEIKVFVGEKKLEQSVIFAGQQANIAGYLSAMDVFLLPSLFEGLPMVALEAQANGLPCILATTITKETAITEKVQFCSLDEMESWLAIIQKINIQKGLERNLTEQDYEKMNLEQLAKNLERYYEMEG